MADNVVDIVAKADYVAAQQEIATLRAKVEALSEAKMKEQVESLTKTLAANADEVKNLKTELENAKAAKKEVEKTLEAAKAETEQVKTKLTDAEKKLDEHAKSIVKANRISTLVDKGVDKAEAEKIVETAVAASDELFTVIVEAHTKLVAAQKCPPGEMMSKEEKAKKAKEKDAAKADEAKLAAATVDADAALSTQADTAADETDAVVAGLADFLSQQIENKKKK